MSDSLLETFLRYGTNAQRIAFTPDPPTVSGVAVKVLYEWRETDTGDVYVYDTAWHLISSGTATAITALTGDVTASGPGSVAATIANNAVTTSKIATTAVTLARIANASASSKLVGSGASGSGSSYAEISLGSGLTMTGTTLSASGTGGTVTATGTLTSGKTIIGNGGSDVTVSSLTGTVVGSSSGTLAAATAGTDYTALAFKTISVSGQSDVVADTAADTLTLAAGSNITLTTNASTDTITIAASGGGGAAGGEFLLGTYTLGGAAQNLDIATRTASGTSGAIFQSDYSNYRVVISNAYPTTNNTNFGIRMSTNGGSSYDSGTNYGWAGAAFRAGGGTLATGGAETTQTRIEFTNALGVANTANWGLRGDMVIYTPLSASDYKFVAGKTMFRYAGGAFTIINDFGGSYQVTTAVDAFQVWCDTSTMATITVQVYGLGK